MNYTTDQRCGLPGGHHGQDAVNNWDLHEDANGSQWDTYIADYRGQTIRVTSDRQAVVMQGFFTIIRSHVINHQKPIDLGYGFAEYPALRLEPPLITISTTLSIPDGYGAPQRIELWSAVPGVDEKWAHFDFRRVESLALDLTAGDLIIYRGRSAPNREGIYCHLQTTNNPPPKGTS